MAEEDRNPLEGSLLGEQMSATQLGFSPIVWRDALFKRIVESEAGRGGVEALCQYSDQIDFIPELRPFRHAMKSGTIFYETALAKCSKDLLKRPVSIREDEVVELLGCICGECGFRSTLRSLLVTENKCPKCGDAHKPWYSKVQYTNNLMKMIKEGMDPTPEAVLMDVAYDRLADSYIAAFKAMKLIMDKTSEIFGWQSFRIEDPQLRNYLDSYHLGRFAGETKTSREEKEILQFLTRGCMAAASLEDAEKLIRLGINVVKYGYLFEVLGVTGADSFYENTLLEYDELYNRMNEEIRKAYLEMYAPVSEESQTVTIGETQGGYYAPCFIMPRSCWESGSISKDLVLQPVYRLPVFPKADFGALQTVFARLGSGKTFLLSAITCYSILSKHELVFCPLNDKSNSYSLAGIPLFGYDKRTKDLLETLAVLGIGPQGVPTITLTVLRKDERIWDVDQHPPTVFDRVVEVESPRGFELDFKQVMRELKEVAEPYGHSRPVGIVCVRNLDRFDREANVNIDVQVASNLLSQFDRWRKGNLSLPSRAVIDEISYIASAQLVLYAGDAARSGATVSDFIKESRRNNLSLDLATQRPLEVMSDIRDAATNVFFRDLPMSKDRTRSQIDFLLDSLQLQDPSVREVVASINNRGLLGKGFWFWHHQPAKKIEVIKPAPPTFCLQDPDMTPRQLLRLYEKETGQNVLLGGWGEVKRLEAAESRQEGGIRFE